jgi:hypothetical protein
MYAPFSCKLLRRDLRQILTVFTWLWGRVRICVVLLQASVLRVDNVVELLAELRAILINIKPAADRKERMNDKVQGFTVKSCYKALTSNTLFDGFVLEVNKALC